ncbi:hypothetical protein [Leptospira andrefontaineae]|uniref:Uncharacterized protein n=1 Tax=Leptospira andrefontaineae TaxID=2484976 RepID=A0A4R9H9J3_9LEPT|nr:hypothetical protein [Leptospira andrefontaineae]TGK42712.1 hypothetical protein EHO65_04695 [Leptospira andrefontaineae]
MQYNTSFWDNWTFESLFDLYSKGLDFSNSRELKINKETNSYDWTEVSTACVQIESLFHLINELVLREKIFYDHKFSAGWNSFESLDSLDGNLLISVDIPTYNPEVADSRNKALELLCVTDQMKKHQEENLEGYRKNKQSPHEYFGQVVWGAAGNLGRSSFLGAHYVAHPIRASLLEQVPLFEPHTDINSEVKEWIDNERMKMFTSLTPVGKMNNFQLVLPPIVAEVIESASKFSEIIPSAMETREKYTKIREWIGEYQTAVELENPSSLSKFRKTLDSVAQDLEKMRKGTDMGNTKVGLSFISLDFPLPKMPDYRKYWGIRGALNKLSLSRKGDKSLTKLLNWLDCPESGESEKIRKYFIL